MRTIPHPTCPVCANGGREVYAALRDRLFGAPGTWRMKRCANPVCGIYWLDPSPTDEDLPIAYRGYYTHSQPDEGSRAGGIRSKVREAYLARRLGYPYRQNKATRMMSWLVSAMPERAHSWLYTYFYLPWVPGGRLLEIGSGSGWQLARMKASGWDVMGLDFDPQAVAASRARGLDVRIGDVRDLALESGSFDAIVMAHVVEHVFDPVGLMRECARLLKPGGRLVAITPNARSIGHRVFGSAWRGLEPPRHIAVFTPKGLRLACTNAGLAVERLDVTARDAANLLLASARTRSAQSNAQSETQIERPRFGQRPPLALRVIAGVERVGNDLGFSWGEELVLTGRKPS
jgi:2-polyprenyl-3-methyl-5-hydroxy-6-metoxy-1,4-benzoquinol methylase